MTLQHHSFGIALLLSLLARDGGCRGPTWRPRRSRLFSFPNPKAHLASQDSMDAATRLSFPFSLFLMWTLTYAQDCECVEACSDDDVSV